RLQGGVGVIRRDFGDQAHASSTALPTKRARRCPPCRSSEAEDTHFGRTGRSSCCRHTEVTSSGCRTCAASATERLAMKLLACCGTDLAGGVQNGLGTPPRL